MNRLALLIPAYLMLLAPVPRQALADFAEFQVAQNGTIIFAAINGNPVAVPPGDRIVTEFYPVGADQSWALWYQDRWSRHYWIEGFAPLGTFGGWEGSVGPFPSFTGPNGRVEIVGPTAQMIDGYEMQRLEGEPVWVTLLPDDQRQITIGAPPLLRVPGDFNGDGTATVQDIFDFLATWAGGYSRADCDGDGFLAAGDIFEFLGAWFGGR